MTGASEPARSRRHIACSMTSVTLRLLRAEGGERAVDAAKAEVDKAVQTEEKAQRVLRKKEEEKQARREAAAPDQLNRYAAR